LVVPSLFLVTLFVVGIDVTFVDWLSMIDTFVVVVDSKVFLYLKVLEVPEVVGDAVE
jgi:hypothetical protein